MGTHYLVLVAALVACPANAQLGKDFPITPPSEDRPAPPSKAPTRLRYCVIDNGVPEGLGSSTNYWIDTKGTVHAQDWEIDLGKGAFENRYSYSLTKAQFQRLQDLLNQLRIDSRVPRERPLSPGERSHCVAFSVTPYADLFVREKHASDHWPNFTAVTEFMHAVHREKTEEPKSLVFKDKEPRNANQPRWQPKGFVSLEFIASLPYIWSERYNAVLDENDKSEQDGADQPATAPESKPEDNQKPELESKVRAQ